MSFRLLAFGIISASFNIVAQSYTLKYWSDQSSYNKIWVNIFSIVAFTALVAYVARLPRPEISKLLNKKRVDDDKKVDNESS